MTRLLHALANGEARAADDLVPLVYEELRRLAGRYMRREQGGHTLQTTALVHEAYLRLVQPQSAPWQNRTHFFAVASTVMRRLLVDHARARHAEKRGGEAPHEPLSIDLGASLAPAPENLLALDAALTRLAALDYRQARIVDLRFFAGLTVEETADVLRISPRTVKREWQMAKAWLYGELNG